MNLWRSLKNRSCEFFYKFFLLPKNIYFNFKLLPWEQAKKLPLFVGYRVKLESLSKNVVEIRSKSLKRGMISFGRGGSEGVAAGRGIISFKSGAKLVFSGSAHFHAGVRLWLDEKAAVYIGDGFSANRNFMLFYNDFISFGKDCMIGWNVNIIDGNGHTVLYGGEEKAASCRIEVGNHVWIGAEVNICRSVRIGDDCIVAYASTVTGGDFGDGIMLGGYPAKTIRDNINWKK